MSEDAERQVRGPLTIRCMSITLSLSLVLIAAGVVGGLLFVSGDQATKDTKEAGHSGRMATLNVCNDGIASLRLAGDNGLSACFDAGMLNAEYLGGLMMEKVVNILYSNTYEFFLRPYLAVMQIRDASRIHHPETLSRTLYDDVFGPWMKHMFNGLMPYGVNTLQQGFQGRPPQMPGRTPAGGDGVGGAKLAMHLESPQTVGKPWTRDVIHKPLLIARPRIDCEEEHSQSTCKANGCPWCEGGSTPYCGHPWRTIDDVTLPCHDGYTPHAAYVEPWFVASKLPFVLSASDSMGKMITGSCGWNTECGCQAYDDYYSKNAAGYDNHRWHTGILPDPHQIGTYMRPDGTWPQSMSVPKDQLLEAGTCPVNPGLAGLTEMTPRTRQYFAHQAGDMQWTPVGLGGKAPILGVTVYSLFTHPDVDSMYRYPDTNVSYYDSVTGSAGASVDVTMISTFLQAQELPPDSRLYIVQSDTQRMAPNGCEDDYHRMLTMAGFTCPVMIGLMGSCEGDLNSLSPLVRKGAGILKNHCPVSCGRCPWKATDVHGWMLGSTHGKVSHDWPLNESLYGNVGLPDRAKAHVLDSDDMIVREHGEWVMGKENSTRNPPSPDDYYDSFDPALMYKWTDSTDTLWWVKASALIHGESDYAMLRVFIVLLVKRDEAMKQIDIATAKTRREIDVEVARTMDELAVKNEETQVMIDGKNKEVEQNSQDALYTTIYIVIGVVIVLLIVSVVFVHFIVLPLLILEAEMADVATMHLEQIDRERPLSLLGEVGRMQKSFLTMVDNLIEYRNYMPASILCDSEEEEEVDQKSIAQSVASSAVNRKDTDLKPKPSNLGKSQHHGTAGGSKASKASRMSVGSVAQSKMSHAKKKFQGGGDGLKKKQVSLAVINIREWHKVISNKNEKDIAANHSDILLHILPLFQKAKGIPDTFSGDRILCSFNGIKPCGTHKSSSTAAALSVRDAISGMQVFGGQVLVSAAIVSGDAKVGNVGCVGMKRFTFFGSMVTWCWALERLNSRYETRGLLDKKCETEAKNSYEIRHIDDISFSKHGSKPLPVFELLGAKKVSEDEWMYQLEEGEKSNPHIAWNKLVAAVLQESWEDAEAVKEQVEAMDVPAPVKLHFLTQLTDKKSAGPTTVSYH